MGGQGRQEVEGQTDKEPELASASPRAPLIPENFPAPLVGIILDK